MEKSHQSPPESKASLVPFFRLPNCGGEEKHRDTHHLSLSLKVTKKSSNKIPAPEFFPEILWPVPGPRTVGPRKWQTRCSDWWHLGLMCIMAVSGSLNIETHQVTLFSHNQGSGYRTLNERKPILEGPNFHFHDYGSVRVGWGSWNTNNFWGLNRPTWQLLLGGGFKCFLNFHPAPWRNDQFWRYQNKIFQMGGSTARLVPQPSLPFPLPSLVINSIWG